MAGVWEAIRFSKQGRLQMGQINFSLTSNRKKNKIMSHGAAVSTDGPNVRVHSIPPEVNTEHTALSGMAAS